MRSHIFVVLLAVAAIVVGFQITRADDLAQEESVQLLNYTGVLAYQALSNQTYTCLVQSGYTIATVQLKWVNGAFEPKNLPLDLYNIFSLDIMLEFSGYESLDTQITTFLAQQKTYNFFKTWIVVKVLDGFKPTCATLRSALNTLIDKQEIVGVYSSRIDWITVFGSDKGCP